MGRDPLTDDRIALLSVSNTLRPCEAACEDPTNRLPIEQIDSTNNELWRDGRKVGACNKGNTGWNFAKYI